MAFAGLNHWAVLMAAAASFALGAAWLWAFGKIRRAATDAAEVGSEDRSASLFRLAYTAGSLWLMAFGLAGVIGHLGIGEVTFRNGIISGIACWLVFVLTTIVVGDGFARRRPVLLAIDGGYWLAALALMGSIIGWMGV